MKHLLYQTVFIICLGFFCGALACQIPTTFQTSESIADSVADSDESLIEMQTDAPTVESKSSVENSEHQSSEQTIYSDSESVCKTVAEIDNDPDESSFIVESETTITETVIEETQPSIEIPDFVVTDAEHKTLYATENVNIRSGPSKDYDRIGFLGCNNSIVKTGEVDNGWIRVEYKGQIGYIAGKYLTDVIPTTMQPETTVAESTASDLSSSYVTANFPKTWSDGRNTITVYQENYAGCVVYAAHLTFSDYNRFGTYCGNNTYGGYCTTSTAAAQLGAILCVNGDYNPPSVGYSCARSGIVYKDGRCYAVGVYSNKTGILSWGDEGSSTGGQQLSSLVASGIVTDTMQFGPALVINGQLRGSNGGSRRPRTVIGTNGQSGDIWIMVSNGDGNDGISTGLTSYESGAYLLSKGCTLVVPLDGGGSSTMVFQGVKLTGGNSERAVADFVYFK